MRTRRTYFKDYKLSKIQVVWLEDFCKRPENRKMLEEAAKEANQDVAEYVIKGLANGWTYREVADKEYVPYNYEDFYGYCRKTLFILWEKLLQNSEVVMQTWLDEGCVRRYLNIKHASAEFDISPEMMKNIAIEAGAYCAFGNLKRIDMRKLYKYLDTK